MLRTEKLIALAGLAFTALFVARDALVRSSLPSQPRRALLAWSGHPEAVIAAGMAAIGEAARVHRAVDARLTAPVIEAARRAPLSIEPFLVAGVKAQTSGDEFAAGQLFQAAEERDPRAAAPHLFLSAHYSKVGQGDRSLTELGRLVRLVPGGASGLVPKIAQSMQQAGGPAAVRALVARSPELRNDIMRAMATDARNFEFVLSLRTATSTNDWQPIMVQSLLAAEKFESAFALWAAANKTNASFSRHPLVFDPAFRLGLDRPFGWTLDDGTAATGLVEPSEATGLHIISFGRDTFLVATQTLLLPAGSYFLTQKVQARTGNISALSWQMSCLVSSKKLGTISFAGDGARGRFDVPEGCRAQRLQLVATPVEVPETLDTILGPIELRRLT